MITKFKIFEQIDLKINDWVVCEEEIMLHITGYDTEYLKTLEFIKNNIGQYVGIDETNTAGCNYKIKYENIPNGVSSYFDKENTRPMSIDEIKFNSQNKKECEKFLEIYKSSKKFNV